MTRILLIALGLFAALVVTLMVFGVDPVRGLALIAEGAFGDKFGVARTLVRTTPLLLCGLGMTVAWRAGMFNIGGEGQYVLGGVFGAAVAKAAAGMNPSLTSAFIMGGAAVGGMSLALFAGWLQVKRGVQCVISTILLNFIVIQGLGWAVRGPLQESRRQLPQTEPLANSAMLQRFDAQTDLHSGVLLAALVAVLVTVWMSVSRAGFKIRVVGQNPRVARAHVMDPGRIQLGAMTVSGALCGLAGGIDYVGLIGHVGDGFAQGWGFLAIPVALLGGLDPVGVSAAALYFGALMAGGEGLARFHATGTTLVFVIQAVAVLGLVALSQLKKSREAVVD